VHDLRLHLLGCPKKIFRLSSTSKPNVLVRNMWFELLVPRFLRVLGSDMESIKWDNCEFESSCVNAGAL